MSVWLDVVVFAIVADDDHDELFFLLLTLSWFVFLAVYFGLMTKRTTKKHEPVQLESS